MSRAPFMFYTGQLDNTSEESIMRKTKNSLRSALLAGTALVAVSIGNVASAQSTIDADGTIVVSAALEGFVAATSQLGTATDLSATVTGGDRSIDLTGTAISDDQSIFGNDVTAQTRLNQSTATLSVSTPESATTLSGATLLTDGAASAAPAASIDAGVGIVSLQDSAVVGTATGDQTFSATVTSGSNSITLDAPTVSGAVTLGGNEAIADVLVNDATNTISASAGGTGNVNVPVAISNLQTITPGADATTNDFDVNINASTTASNTVVIDSTNTLLSDDVRIDENTIGARAGANTAVNDLFAGDAEGAALGSLSGTLDATALDTSGAVASFVADFAVANLQRLEQGTNGNGAVNVTATTVGAMELTLAPATVTSSSPELSLSSNTILSDAAGNTATNRAVVTTEGLNGVSVGVASVQEASGLDTVTGDIAANTTGPIMISGAAGTAGTAGGKLDGTTVNMSGNTIGANAVGNEALNIAAVTSTGSLDGSTSYVAGRQTANDMSIMATVTNGDITANFAEIAGTSTVAMNGNDVYATAALNTQTNMAQNTGSSAFGGTSMASTSRQEIVGGSVASLITSADISLIGVAASTVPTSIANNTVLASATGNVSTTSISNRSSNFSFTR